MKLKQKSMRICNQMKTIRKQMEIKDKSMKSCKQMKTIRKQTKIINGIQAGINENPAKSMKIKYKSKKIIGFHGATMD